MIIFYSHGGFGNQLFITWRAYFLRSLGRRAFISTALSNQSFLPTPLSKLDALNHSLHLTSQVVNIISFFALPILFVVKRLRHLLPLNEGSLVIHSIQFIALTSFFVNLFVQIGILRKMLHNFSSGFFMLILFGD